MRSTVLLSLLVLAAVPAQAAIPLDLSYVDTATPAYTRFKTWVDQAVAGTPHYAFSATDAAYMYRIQGGSQYATKAIQMVEAQVAAAEALIATGQRPAVSGDSYLDVGPMIRDLSLVYDWCNPLLTPAQRTRWANYANQAIYNVWNPGTATWGGVSHTWSGWSINDPGNNYHYSFLEATMYWAFASNSTSWRTFIETQKIPPLTTYFAALPGGGSREGTAYGLSHMRLFELYRFWRDGTGTNLGAASTHLDDSLDWWMHATTPTLDRVAPIGDQARVSYPEIFDYHRNVMIQARTMSGDATRRARASWWLDNISIDPMSMGFNFRHDLLPTGGVGTIPTARWYYATGTGHLFARTGWDRNAMWIDFAAGTFDQSHAHEDQGAFTLFSGDFLAVTENVFTHSGIQQGNEVHNNLRFVTGSTSARQCRGTNSTMTVTPAANGAIIANANLAPAYTGPCNSGVPVPSAWQRNLRFAKRAVRVTDTFTVPGGTQAVFQINTPVQPTINGVNASAGRLRVRVISPANATLTSYDWRNSGASEFTSGWKIEVRGGTTGYTVELYDSDTIFNDGLEAASP